MQRILQEVSIFANIIKPTDNTLGRDANGQFRSSAQKGGLPLDSALPPVRGFHASWTRELRSCPDQVWRHHFRCATVGGLSLDERLVWAVSSGTALGRGRHPYSGRYRFCHPGGAALAPPNPRHTAVMVDLGLRPDSMADRAHSHGGHFLIVVIYIRNFARLVI